MAVYLGLLKTYFIYSKYKYQHMYPSPKLIYKIFNIQLKSFICLYLITYFSTMPTISHCDVTSLSNMVFIIYLYVFLNIILLYTFITFRNGIILYVSCCSLCLFLPLFLRFIYIFANSSPFIFAVI